MNPISRFLGRRSLGESHRGATNLLYLGKKLMGDTGEMGVRTKKMGEPPKRKTGNATELNVTRKQIGKFQEGFGKELEQTTREGLRKDSEKVLKRQVKDSETTRKLLGNDSATTRTCDVIAVLHKYIKLGNSHGLITTVLPKL